MPAPSTPQATLLSQRVYPHVPDADKRYKAPLDIVLQATQRPIPSEIRSLIQARFGEYLGQGTYPILVGNELVALLAERCLADLSPEAARRLIGRYYLLRFRETILGRVLLATLPLMGWERALRRVPQDLGAVTNYGTRAVYELAPRHCQVVCQDEVIDPDMMQGTLEAMAEITHVDHLQIRHEQPDPHTVIFDLTW